MIQQNEQITELSFMDIIEFLQQLKLIVGKLYLIGDKNDLTYIHRNYFSQIV